MFVLFFILMIMFFSEINISQNLLPNIKLNWKLENKDIKQIHNTTWQIGDDYVLKLYQDLNILERNLKILQLLDSMEIPVGRPIATINNEQYENIVSQLAMVYNGLPVQLIHRDVHFGNFLFSDGIFSGYIDFDLSRRNIQIFDLCYFSLGVLSEKEKFDITEELWFDLLNKVFTAYGKKLKLTDAEKKAVPYVIECIELLFVSYFESVSDIHCAEDAYKIFAFVKMQENRICRSLS